VRTAELAVVIVIFAAASAKRGRGQAQVVIADMGALPVTLTYSIACQGSRMVLHTMRTRTVLLVVAANPCSPFHILVAKNWMRAGGAKNIRLVRCNYEWTN